jgi:hypothetical protein
MPGHQSTALPLSTSDRRFGAVRAGGYMIRTVGGLSPPAAPTGGPRRALPKAAPSRLLKGLLSPACAPMRRAASRRRALHWCASARTTLPRRYRARRRRQGALRIPCRAGAANAGGTTAHLWLVPRLVLVGLRWRHRSCVGCSIAVLRVWHSDAPFNGPAPVGIRTAARRESAVHRCRDRRFEEGAAGAKNNAPRFPCERLISVRNRGTRIVPS